MKKSLYVAFILLLLCSQTVWADVEILSINDFHGWVEEAGASIGMVKLVTFIKQYRLEHPDTIVVSGGDNYQGEALSNLSRGDLVNELFRSIGLKVSSVGNHEFDWGPDLFGRWSSSGVQYLAANIVDEKTRRSVSWAKPYVIVQSGEHKIAFIGLSTRETPGSTAAKHLKGLRFERAAVAAAHWIRYLQEGKDQQGVPDAIILLTHIPSYQERVTGIITGDELAELTRLGGVNAVITGHSHKLVSGRRHGIPVIQAACFGKALGVLHLKFDGRKLSGIIPEVIEFKELSATLIPDPGAGTIMDTYRKRLQGIIERKICRLKTDLPFERNQVETQTPLGYLICNAVRTQTGVQVALINNGAIRHGLSAGDVTYGHIMGVFPFDDYVVTMRMTGRDLRTLIGNACVGKSMRPCQVAGVRLKVRPGLHGALSILALELENGAAINDHALYSLAVPDYIFEGGDGHNFATARDARYIYVQLRDLLVEYLETRQVIEAPDISKVYRVAVF